MGSLIQKDKNYCFICGGGGLLEKHHVFNGSSNRQKSEKDSMYIFLHRPCHEYLHRNELKDCELKAYCQVIWQSHFGTEEDFIKRYGKSYIARLEYLKGNCNADQGCNYGDPYEISENEGKR